MADNTKIEWADATLNFINGCEVLSPGCTNCYAMALAGVRLKNVASRRGLTQSTKSGKPVWNGMVQLHMPHLWQALKWQRPRRIFWNAHGDMFLGAVPTSWIDTQFAIMAITPQHTHMILSKRTKAMRTYLKDRETPRRIAAVLVDLHRKGNITTAQFDRASYDNVCDAVLWPLRNVWVGTSVEDQERADMRVPDLLDSPAAIRFLSMEPLLGPVQLGSLPMPTGMQVCDCRGDRPTFDALQGSVFCAGCCEGPERFDTRIDWMIVGGENGPRPMHQDWIRSLQQQSAEADVPFFFKQWGSSLPGNMDGEDEHGGPAYQIEDVAQPVDYDALGRGKLIQAHGADFIHFHRKSATGRMLDGVEHNGVPEVEA